LGFGATGVGSQDSVVIVSVFWSDTVTTTDGPPASTARGDRGCPTRKLHGNIV
jgi:hypothetical protein